MPDYEEMYYTLFSVLCDAIESIEEPNYEKAKELLIQALQKAEEMYIEADEPE